VIPCTQSESLPILFNRVLVFIAIPFLALVGLLFLCVRVLLAGSLHIVGWKLAWPPVEVSESEAERWD
jgi:hypothetical protein